MSILYEDRYIICDDVAVTINDYFFPQGSKRIPYAEIRKVSEKPLTLFKGKLRIWGMDLEPFWYHYDLKRPTKSQGICLDIGELLKPVLTPEDHDAVLLLLKEKTQGNV